MWFSRFLRHHFIKTVGLVGNFVSYRLLRQHRRKHISGTNIVAELISETQRSKISDSAQLHIALGMSRNSKTERKPTITYSEDWQIRAAARVMALLFSANSSGPHRRQDFLQSTSLKLSTVDGCPLSPRDAHGPKQILEMSMFYIPFWITRILSPNLRHRKPRQGSLAFASIQCFYQYGPKFT